MQLPLPLVLESLGDVAEGVQVLHLRLRAERARASRAQREVGVAAEAAFFHIAITDLNILEQRPQAAQIITRFRGRPDIRFADNL